MWIISPLHRHIYGNISLLPQPFRFAATTIYGSLAGAFVISSAVGIWNGAFTFGSDEDLSRVRFSNAFDHGAPKGEKFVDDYRDKISHNLWPSLGISKSSWTAKTGNFVGDTLVGFWAEKGAWAGSGLGHGIGDIITHSFNKGLDAMGWRSSAAIDAPTRPISVAFLPSSDSAYRQKLIS